MREHKLMLMLLVQKVVNRLQRALIVCMENILARQGNGIGVLVVVPNAKEMEHMEISAQCGAAQNAKWTCVKHHALKYTIPEMIIGNMHQSERYINHCCQSLIYNAQLYILWIINAELVLSNWSISQLLKGGGRGQSTFILKVSTYLDLHVYVQAVTELLEEVYELGMLKGKRVGMKKTWFS